MKLKTLKDIERHDKENWVTEKKLRAEAIKWVNYYGIDDGEIGACFLKFFNITEEDLK